MYKVFIDNTPIYFRKSGMLINSLSPKYLPSLEKTDFENFKNYIKSSLSNDGLYFNSENPLESLHLFFKNFRWIEAAGGVVKNSSDHKFLFIFRNGLWDIPKGKIEHGETPEVAAVREIQEECGLQHIVISKSLTPTYHVYHAYGDYWIKKTHWFYLETNEIELTPQTEEGITEVKWFDRSDFDVVKSKTYASIKEVLMEI